MTTSTKRNFTKGALTLGSAVVTLTGVAALQQAEAVTATGTGNIQAEIINLPTVAESVVMDFGTFSPGTVPSTAQITPSTGAVTVTVGDASDFGTPSQGVMTITNAPVGVPLTYSATATAPLNDGGVNTMAVSAFVLEDRTDSNAAATLTAPGVITVDVGADLAIGVGHHFGSYTGTYTMNVNY